MRLSLPFSSKLGFEFFRNRSAAELCRVIRGSDRPNPFLNAFNGKHLTAIKPVLDGETAPSPLFYARIHLHYVSKRRRRDEVAACMHEGDSRDLVLPQQFRLLDSQGMLKKRICTSVEIFEIPGKEDNSKRITIAPLNLNFFSVNEHSLRRHNLPKWPSLSLSQRLFRRSAFGFLLCVYGRLKTRTSFHD